MSKERHVLIVEDDAALLRGVSDHFAFKGFRVDTASDGEEGLRKALEVQPDLYILDVMLPGVNGYEICRRIREEGIRAPAIFLTAKAEESDILLGLGIGADDYVTKPFSVRELMARAEAVLRRAGDGGEEVDAEGRVTFGEFVFDPEAHRLLDRGGDPVALSPKEYDLLECFLQHRGKAMSRDEIMNKVWGYDVSVTPRSIDRFVTSLRKKLQSGADGKEWIETIREYGYRFRNSGVS